MANESAFVTLAVGLSSVSLGWLLAELTHGLREDANKRRRLRRSLAMLLGAHSLVLRRQRLIDHLKDAVESLEELQAIREAILSRYSEEENRLRKETNDAIETYLDFMPLRVADIRGISEGLLHKEGYNLRGMVDVSDDSFITALSLIEAGDDALLLLIERNLKGVALRIGPLTRIQISIFIHEARSPSKKQRMNEEAVLKYMTKLLEGIRTTRQ